VIRKTAICVGTTSLSGIQITQLFLEFLHRVYCKNSLFIQLVLWIRHPRTENLFLWVPVSFFWGGSLE